MSVIPRAKVVAYIEATDPDHPMGLTEEDFERLSGQLMELGLEDIEIELEVV